MDSQRIERASRSSTDDVGVTTDPRTEADFEMQSYCPLFANHFCGYAGAQTDAEDAEDPSDIIAPVRRR